jgi:RNA polymerase sigma-70 factor, ECF subfamily
MKPSTAPAVNVAIDYTMREDRGRLIAALFAVIGDFELAEECLQDAVEAALGQWPTTGIPKSRRGWLLQVARRKAIDRLRRGQNFTRKAAQIAVLEQADSAGEQQSHEIPDDRLRLIFTCCHPALEQKTQVALTLRTLGGLTTAEIARAFLDSVPAMAQRLSRARSKISKAGIPFVIPEGDDLAPRLGSVLKVIYLIYNEGYGATVGAHQVRLDLCAEALFLARLLVQLSPDETETNGLLALILFSMARRPARLSNRGGYVPLSHQDRSQWDQKLIIEAQAALDFALAANRPGPFQVQAAISALHCEAKQANDTDWVQIAALYLGLCAMDDTPIVRLNHLVAHSNVVGAAATLPRLKALRDLHPDMAQYQPFQAALADMLRRAGQAEEAKRAFQAAIALTGVDSERAYLKAQISEL